MIVTLTANPSIDRTVQLDGPLRRSEVQRSSSATSLAGGKGVNVARAIHRAGHPALAVLPASIGDPMHALLQQRELPFLAVDADFSVRTNLTIAEADGTTTKINEPGQELNAESAEALISALCNASQDATWVALCGSLPLGLAANWYSKVIAKLNDMGVRIALDTSGAPLIETMAGEHLPSFLKPNSDELAELTGGDPVAFEQDLDLVVAAGKQILARGLEYVLVTLGEKGAVLVTAAGQWHAVHAPVTPVSTVGAGDSTLSGFLLSLSEGCSPEQALVRAVAYGSAAVQLPGSGVPTPSDVTEGRVSLSVLA